MTTKQSKKPTTVTSIKVRLSPTLKRQLQDFATQRNISLSSLMRLIATEYIKTKG